MFLANDVQAQVVKGRHGKPAGLFALHQLPHPFAHFAGRLIGEGDRHDAMGGHVAFFDQVGDLTGDYTGFARAGTGQHQQGAVNIVYSFGLAGI